MTAGSALKTLSNALHASMGRQKSLKAAGFTRNAERTVGDNYDYQAGPNRSKAWHAGMADVAKGCEAAVRGGASPLSTLTVVETAGNWSKDTFLLAYEAERACNRGIEHAQPHEKPSWFWRHVLGEFERDLFSGQIEEMYSE